MDVEDLAHLGDDVRLVQHQPGHRGGVVVGQGPIKLAIEVADGHAALDDIGAVARLVDTGGFDHVGLVVNVADDFLQDVFQRNDAFKAAVLVHHHGKVRALLAEILELVGQRGAGGNEPGLGGQGADVQLAGVAFAGPQRAQQLFGVQNADDVVGIAGIERQAGIGAFHNLGDDGLGLLVDVDHRHVAAVGHNLLDRHVREIQDRAQHVAGFSGLFVFGVGVQFDGAAQLFFGFLALGVGVGAVTDRPQHKAHHALNGADHGPGDRDQPGHRARHLQRHLVGVTDGIGFGQHLSKDHHQRGHNQGREQNARFPHQGDEQRSGQRRGQDVDQVVGQQNRADQGLRILQQQVGSGGCRRTLALKLMQARARGTGQGGFRAREHRRQADQNRHQHAKQDQNEHSGDLG